MTLNIGGRECVRGIDVAQYQPPSTINYGVVKSVRDFAYIKATEGGNYTDPTYAGHRDNFRNVGMPLGAYHYLQTGDGAAQARNFLNVTNNYSGFDLPVVVDYEQAGVNSGHVNAFIEVIEQTISKRWTGPNGQPVACIIYTGNYFNPGDRPASWKRMDMWVAGYTNKNYPNPGPEPQFLPVVGASAPWSQWSIWQCNGGDGRCPGVGGGNGQCDQDVATVEWFNRTLGGAVEEEDVKYREWEDADKNALADDVAIKVLYAVSGRAKAQGQAWAQDDLNLDDVQKHMVSDEVVSAGALKDLWAISGWAKAEGQPDYQKFLNLGDVLAAELANQPADTPPPDPAAMAAAIANALGNDVAKKVADELAKRLNG